jgi:hypothetical protein
MSYQRSWLRFILNVAGYDEMPTIQCTGAAFFQHFQNVVYVSQE